MDDDALDDGAAVDAEPSDRYDQDGPGLLDAPVTEAPAKAASRRPAKAESKPSAAKPRADGGVKPAAGAKPSDGAKPAAPDAPLALYRRYRPDTFDEIIGQEHVTEPLKRALANNKVNHAYLFSGPRGCGKTSSARILARCLNCEQGPTATPCGVCRSCRELATGGPGSIDVIEMDAATHGLVDDARDLRERAFFTPVQSRYKVYIIDEAHMVTTAGFNALLKLVEEPPPHVRFIFATTEPEKVIGTIKSRTHHYPFRLVPPKIMQSYLEKICAEEGVAVEPGVLPLVVRAGAGSVRDSLSVLDQLLGAAGPDGVSYAETTALLGYTPDALLDDTVDAFAAGDGAAVFAAIDKVIETGQDPRHFAADLLQRLRDVLIVASVPDALTSGLLDVPVDQGERLQHQAEALGQARLTYAAEVMAKGLTGMRGTTVPRLHLELMCARVLLPEQGTEALAARLDKVERRLGAGGPMSTPALGAPTASGAGVTRPAGERPAETAPAQEPGSGRPSFEDEPPAAAPPTQQRPAAEAPRADRDAVPAVPSQAATVTPPAGTRASQPPTQAPPAAARPAPAAGPSPDQGIAQLRDAWPAVLDRVLQARRLVYILLSQNASPQEARDGTLTLGFSNPGARDTFLSGNNPNFLTQALADVTGQHWRVNAILAGPDAAEPQQRPAAGPPAQAPSRPAEGAPRAVRTPPAIVVQPEAHVAPPPSEKVPPRADQTGADDEVSVDDADIDDSADPAELLSSTLGAELIAEEIEDV